MMVGRVQRRVHADDVDGVGEPGVVTRLVRVVGACAGAEDQREERLVGRARVARAAELRHLEPHCGRRRTRAAHRHPCPGRERGHDEPAHEGAHHQGDQRAALRPTPCHLGPLVVVVGGVVVVGASIPPPDRATAMLNAVTFHAPDASGVSTRSPLRTMRSGSFLGRGDALDVEVDGGGREHDRAALVAEADHRDRLRGDVQVAGDLGEPFVDHHRTVRAGDPGERAGAEERRQVTGGLGGTKRVHRGGGQVVADHLEDGLGLLRT